MEPRTMRSDAARISVSDNPSTLPGPKNAPIPAP